MLAIENWLNSPGLVKKLQIALCISVVFNIFLLMSKIPSVKKEQPAVQLRQEEPKTEHKTSEIEIKVFIKEYLNYFFSTGLVAKSFIEKHSDSLLFKDQLEAQLDSRTKAELASNFNILDFYIEALGKQAYKVILVGIESFLNKDYKNREITMILNLNYSEGKFTVSSIPQFDIK
jgi:hypothetical protein